MINDVFFKILFAILFVERKDEVCNYQIPFVIKYINIYVFGVWVGIINVTQIVITQIVLCNDFLLRSIIREEK